jgi:hypothetical protein
VLLLSGSEKLLSPLFAHTTMAQMYIIEQLSKISKISVRFLICILKSMKWIRPHFSTSINGS